VNQRAFPTCDLSIMVLLLVAFIGMQLAFAAADAPS
jgi:hypothetical protein